METISLSPWALFESAGAVGRAVMVSLALASVWSWVLIAESIYALGRIRRAFNASSAQDVLLAPVFEAGRTASNRRLPGETTGELRLRLVEAMMSAARGLLVRAEGRLPDLAVIASVAPFVGLFGTVWGIMVSFAGIASARDTSLAVVAPGIAEALAATAWGLAAAIPASIGYTRIGTAFSNVASEIADRVEAHAVDLVEQGGRS
ncbi:MAG: flagellar motor protein MotA [Phyllobacteriaceae bacterium]|nr:flagellar motor protein MotA [Phyllobacteriaceae bacterium]